ncbi:hypothetical protein G7Y89_g5487 [Cudoniella acicularis]|uniref:Uncharacterized protein n=1 Tax=Cudoniella acicularis TaxID=354080 RepID=A0A8H4RNS5_9HELO|nr:hypothetical protein G7Y89_g5487 [Cudoniella acicularis]
MSPTPPGTTMRSSNAISQNDKRESHVQDQTEQDAVPAQNIQLRTPSRVENPMLGQWLRAPPDTEYWNTEAMYFRELAGNSVKANAGRT